MFVRDRNPSRNRPRAGRLAGMRSRWTFWIWILTTCGAVLGCAGSGVDAPSPERWRAVKDEIRSQFPGVRNLTTEDVVALPKDVVLVDVRRADEYAVSRLPGAIHASSDGDLAAIPRDRPVVVYCSVGYRSAQVADRLAKDGHPDVRNYLGSIFEWANAGHALENDAGAATTVHPFNADWGQLLRPERRQD